MKLWGRGVKRVFEQYPRKQVPCQPEFILIKLVLSESEVRMFCPNCGTPAPENTVNCPSCGKPLPRAPYDAFKGMDYLMPVRTSVWAIAAGYLGLFCLILLPAPFAIIAGCIALWDLKRKPHLHGRVRAWFGIIAGSLVIVGLILLVLFAK